MISPFQMNQKNQLIWTEILDFGFFFLEMTDKKLARTLEESNMISHINKKPKKIVIKNFKGKQMQWLF